jgi:ADP-L-glycero-D-manno-heptose 6-epimerase
MKCLVTGGAGFIGSNLALHLEKEGHDVSVLDNFSSGHKVNLENFNGKVIDKDISKTTKIGKYDTVFHQAAITDPRYDNDQKIIMQNVYGFQNILEYIKNNNATLVYASSASLYGNGSSPQKEDQPKEILSAYAQSKLIMDEMASHNFDTLQIVGLRYFNVFGPNEMHKGRPASMVYHLTKQMKLGKRPKLFKRGEQRRDHIYVKDCIRANIKAMKAKPGIYNVGTGVATSFNQLVEQINKVIGSNLAPEYFDMPYNPKTYQFNTQADTRKAEKILGFKARYKLLDAIKEYSEMI